MMRRQVAAIWATLLCSMVFSDLSQAQGQTGSPCGDPFRNHYGPYDYRVTTPQQRAIVENVHFTPAVESLRAGNTSMGPGGDLDYTLNVYPNHHRALMSMMKFAVRERNARPGGVQFSIECRFDRAERFRPDDAMVKVIHGLYLIQTGKPADAITKLEQARELDSNNANVHYNLGLAYFDLKKFDQALESAHVAYAQGFPLPGLRDKLRRAGKWRDPVPVVESASPEVTMPESVEDAVQPDPQATPAAD
ncbi:tetratricopeptide repeat protein [Parazoarcus communis]|uniref:tetratricopeptide repeat protein n=1 Tax=Parazoarcus communis TaxID=41977 RepID=UPI002006EA14|nr:tetratricopeptide repeat protein [Parazoarcus communis]